MGNVFEDFDFFNDSVFGLNLHSEPFDDAIIGRRVRISGSQLKWAEGMTGVIQDLLTTRDLSGIECKVKVKVLLDDMDRSKPPYGLVIVTPAEIDFISDEEPETKEKKTAEKPDREKVIQKLSELAISGFLSTEYHDAVENAITLIKFGGEKK